MLDENTQKALESLSRRKANSSIAIAADLANDQLNSICRFALAWISEGSVHAISYLVQPPDGEFTCRDVTPAMVQNSKGFAAVWDEEIRVLLKGEIISAYRSEQLFLAIKSSYEACGKPFQMGDVYVRDLKFLASTYIAELGNDSFTSIMHYMKIPVDMDNALSRAMACACSFDWMEKLYPISSYGIPLSAIMAGALRPLADAETARPDEKKQKKYLRLQYYTKIFFLPFVMLCVILTGYYLHRYEENQKTTVNFSAYTTAQTPPSEPEETGPLPSFTPQGHYLMLRGTYIILNESTIAEFSAAVKAHEIERIRTMVRSDQILVFANPTRIQIAGELRPDGFIPVHVLEGDYEGKQGYAQYTMIAK